MEHSGRVSRVGGGVRVNGETLRLLRESAGIKVSEVDSVVRPFGFSLPSSTVSTIESRHVTKPNFVLVLAALYGVKPASLLADKERDLTYFLKRSAEYKLQFLDKKQDLVGLQNRNNATPVFEQNTVLAEDHDLFEEPDDENAKDLLLLKNIEEVGFERRWSSDLVTTAVHYSSYFGIPHNKVNSRIQALVKKQTLEMDKDVFFLSAPAAAAFITGAGINVDPAKLKNGLHLLTLKAINEMTQTFKNDRAAKFNAAASERAADKTKEDMDRITSPCQPSLFKNSNSVEDDRSQKLFSLLERIASALERQHSLPAVQGHTVSYPDQFLDVISKERLCKIYFHSSINADVAGMFFAGLGHPTKDVTIASGSKLVERVPMFLHTNDIPSKIKKIVETVAVVGVYEDYWKATSSLLEQGWFKIFKPTEHDTHGADLLRLWEAPISRHRRDETQQDPAEFFEYLDYEIVENASASSVI